jgi:hypothetical protein
MSLLQHENPELDDAARGESFTKGTSHVIIASIAAVVLVSLAVVLYIVTGQKPPVATGEVVAVWAVPHHVGSSGFDAAGARVPADTFDQMLVFAQVKLHNQTSHPLFLNGITGNATLADGIHSSYAAPKSGYNDVFLAYEGLPVPRGTPLSSDATLQPGQTIEGAIVCSFRMTKQEWDARKNLNFGFGFQYHPVLKLTPQPGVVHTY